MVAARFVDCFSRDFHVQNFKNEFGAAIGRPEFII
jgi:hypothetical protein